jgi:hypothetical protein
MRIEATHKITGAPLVFESTSADAATLDNVKDPAALPNLQKLAFFERKRQLAYKAKISILCRHRDRLKGILLDIWNRAPGPKDDEVHRLIRSTAANCTVVLEKFKAYAKTGDKKFDEKALIEQLRTVLVALKGSVPDVAATAAHIAGLETARQQVGDVLARAEAGIRAWVSGASIAYRGSLATGWRNENKSKDGVAQRIDLFSFDSDAFVTIPHETWAGWQKLGIVLDNKVKDKMSLDDLIVRASHADDSADTQRVRSQLAGIKMVEAQLRDAMASVKGYKMKGDVADFEFVLQSSEKTVRELTSGNLYPLDEVAKAGLPLTEVDLKVVVEGGVIKVMMPERHISMSAAVETKTYPSDPKSVPHTETRPTERMLIDEYFNPPKQPLREVVTVERNLMEHFNAQAETFVFNTEAWR